MSACLLVVPPLLKCTTGPLLGPAMLAGAAAAAGHDVDVLDLNALHLTGALGHGLPPGRMVGDHDRPVGLLRDVQRAYVAQMAAHLPADPGLLDEAPALTLPYAHAAIAAAADTLTATPWADRLDALLAGERRPDLVGISLLYAGQVLGAAVVTRLVRRRWPGVPVVWGGPHVTALRDEIARDARYGAAADGFVFGYAERTFVALLDAVGAGAPWPQAVVRAGAGVALDAEEDAAVLPRFDRLGVYASARRTLPAQASRGCAYGRCRFCTYPAVEGAYRALGLDGLEPIVRQAHALGGTIAFKDSLVLPARLDALAQQVAGRVPWAACTKLHASLDAARLRSLAAGGCATLEVGLETLTAEGQLLIDKRQPLGLLLGVLDAAESAGVGMVVNYMTGFPGADPGAEADALAQLRAELARRPGLLSVIEHNRFQLERRSPLGREPERWGLRVRGAWPWATVLAWEAAEARAAA